MAPLAQPDAAAARWAARWRDLPIPVLASTAAEIDDLRDHEDAADANMLGELIAVDPLMTLRVLAHSGRHRPATRLTDTATVTACVVMMGIPPFFRTFAALETVERQLAAHPDALQGLMDVVRRSHRAARFALAFAVHRMDPDAALIYQAALLHETAEMLLWCHAPELALQLRDAQRADPALRSAEAQRELLGAELPDIEHALMLDWHLPERLIALSDDRHAQQPGPHCVLLGLRVARHSARGWDNPALPDDVAELAELLTLSPDAALALLHDADS